MGTVPPNKSSPPVEQGDRIITSSLVQSYGLLSTRLEEALERFWKIEEPPSKPAVHPDHLECERLYQSTTTRMPDGKYMVRLPLKSDKLPLGEFKGLAIQRFKLLERKMERDPIFLLRNIESS